MPESSTPSAFDGYGVLVPMADFRKMQGIESVAGDLWNELENMLALAWWPRRVACSTRSDRKGWRDA